MIDVFAAAPFVVISALVYSGVSKLGARAAVSESAEALGLPDSVAAFAGRWLAPLEIATAALMVPAATAAVGAAFAFALFGAFTALVGWNLARGRRPACACFGAASASPISNWTLGRNVLLSSLAGLSLSSTPGVGGAGLLARVVVGAGTDATLAWLIVANAALLLVVLARRPSRDLEAVAPPQPASAPEPESSPGWPIGVPAPSFDLPALEGGRTGLSDLVARDRDVVLIFTSPDCSTCAALLPEIALWQERHANDVTIAIVTQGPAASHRDDAREFGLRRVLLQGDREVAAAFRAGAAPSAVVVDRSRRVASRVAVGAVEIRRLVEARAVRARVPAGVVSPAPPPDPVQLPLGDPAPPFDLPALRGGAVDLEQFAGRLTALIFWNPSCGFCRALAPLLLERETRAHDDGGAQVAVVSAGSREGAEAEGFRSPVLLDADGVVAKAYGSDGTPSAILVDAEGRVASRLAKGREEIEALLNRADGMTRAARRVTA